MKRGLAPLPRMKPCWCAGITEQAKLKRMKSDSSNRASHETPHASFTNAILMVNLIQEGGAPVELQEYWSILTSELDRQKVRIERLLMAGRLESRALKLEISPIDLVASWKKSIPGKSSCSPIRRISPSRYPYLQSRQCVGDKSGLQQVFINLINNAIQVFTGREN